MGPTTYLEILVNEKNEEKVVIYKMKDIHKIKFKSTYMKELKENLIELEGFLSLKE